MQSVKFLVTSHGDSDLASILLGDESNPRSLAVNHRTHVGDVDRHFLLDDAALGTLLRRLERLLADVDSLDDNPFSGDIDGHDLSGTALVVAGSDDHEVISLYVTWHQTTSVARDTIFM